MSKPKRLPRPKQPSRRKRDWPPKELRLPSLATLRKLSEAKPVEQQLELFTNRKPRRSK